MGGSQVATGGALADEGCGEGRGEAGDGVVGSEAALSTWGSAASMFTPCSTRSMRVARSPLLAASRSSCSCASSCASRRLVRRSLLFPNMPMRLLLLLRLRGDEHDHRGGLIASWNDGMKVAALHRVASKGCYRIGVVTTDLRWLYLRCREIQSMPSPPRGTNNTNSEATVRRGSQVIQGTATNALEKG